jgi:FHA domain
MKAELVPENGDPPVPIERDVTVIGRHESCDVVIPHQSLSKRHCVFVKTDGLLVIRDLATTNGTKVKGQRVRWAALLPDDKVSLGGYKVRVYLGSDEMPSPSEQRRARSGQPAAMPRAGALLQGPSSPVKAAELVPPSGAPRPALTGFPAPSNHGGDEEEERWAGTFVAPGGEETESGRVAAAALPGAGFEVIDEPRFELVEDDEEIIDLE